ncbi:MAG: tRNA lysidine(34) synthetase TilS [Phycisphaerae bacterium]|nr:tRNA lysidine(34) synthetase TilS [Phycisphaerae bacterium]
MESSIRETIESLALVSRGDRVLLAVSGGVDSVVMAAVFQQIQSLHPVCRDFVIGHVNHHLRGDESDEDEQFVRQLAKQWNLPVQVRSVDVAERRRSHKQSMETAARELRLNALAEIAIETGCHRIATAHHADDQVETMIHRLQRGTGFRGLCGIAPIRSLDTGLLFIRPMLNVSRAEILDFAGKYGLSWRKDSSNVSIDYTRNRIRHLLLPELVRMNPRLPDQFRELAGHCRRFQQKVEDECEQVRSRVIQSRHSEQTILHRDTLVILPEPVRVELLRQSLAELGCGEQNLGIQQFRSLHRLMQGPPGRSLNLPGGFCARTDSSTLILCRGPFGSFLSAVKEDGVAIPIPGKIAFGRFEIESQTLNRDECDCATFFETKPPTIEWFDLDRIVPPLRIRRRRPGDRFVPLGQTEEKKIGKFLTAQKTSDGLRRRILIVEDTRQILWVAPLRISEVARIRPQTRRIVEISVRLVPGHPA